MIIAEVFFGFVDVVAGDTVFMTAFGTTPNILMVIKPRLVVQIGIAAITIPIDAGETFSHNDSSSYLFFALG